MVLRLKSELKRHQPNVQHVKPWEPPRNRLLLSRHAWTLLLLVPSPPAAAGVNLSRRLSLGQLLFCWSSSRLFHSGSAPLVPPFFLQQLGRWCSKRYGGIQAAEAATVISSSTGTPRGAPPPPIPPCSADFFCEFIKIGNCFACRNMHKEVLPIVFSSFGFHSALCDYLSLQREQSLHKRWIFFFAVQETIFHYYRSFRWSLVGWLFLLATKNHIYSNTL